LPSIKEFIEALQAGWFPALVALVGCSLLVAGHWYKLPYLEVFPDWVVTTAVVIGVFSFGIIVANIVYLPVVIWRMITRRRAKKQFKDWIQKEILAAPTAEVAILAYLLSSGRRAFAAEINDRRLTPLVTKGFLIRLGGTHSALEWPYLVQEDVWEFLQSNREQFFRPDWANQPDPFHWRGNW